MAIVAAQILGNVKQSQEDRAKLGVNIQEELKAAQDDKDKADAEEKVIQALKNTEDQQKNTSSAPTTPAAPQTH